MIVTIFRLFDEVITLCTAATSMAESESNITTSSTVQERLQWCEGGLCEDVQQTTVMRRNARRL